MELKIKIPNDSEYLLKDDQQFKIFIYEYFKFKDQIFNDKYNLNNIIIKIYNSLEENNEFIIYQTHFNYSDTIKLLKKQYGVYKNIIIPEFILKKFNLSIFNSLKTCYFNKVKVININNELIEKTYTFYDKNKDNYAYFAILNEIINHYYAYILYENYKKINKCEFKIPRLYKIIKKKDKNNNIKLTIQMEYISNIDILNYNEQQKQECEKLITHMLIFFENNYLFHNDTHINNILFQNDNIISLIDFGQASIHENFNDNDYCFDIYSKKDNKFNNWLNQKRNIFY